MRPEIAQPQPAGHPDQVVLESLPMLINESQEA